jgi:hypothetical protein
MAAYTAAKFAVLGLIHAVEWLVTMASTTFAA